MDKQTKFVNNDVTTGSTGIAALRNNSNAFVITILQDLGNLLGRLRK